MPKRSKYPGLRAHSWKTAGGEVRTAYYLDNRGGRHQPDGPAEISLGTDFAEAVRQWTALVLLKPLEAGTMKAAFDAWERDVLPSYKPVTRRDYGLCLTQLRPVFQGARWEEVTMPVLTEYLRKRTGKTRANRELAVLSIIWNWSILAGLTKLPYPAAGLKRSRWKNKEKARGIEVTPELFAAVYAEADQVLRDAMDIASATALRLTDVVTATLPGADGVIRGEASKTGKRYAFDAAGSDALRPVLDGDLLDAAVALADGRLVVADEPGWPAGDYKRMRAKFGGRHVVRWYGTSGELGGWEPINNQGSPSTDWSIGGPILDRMTPCDLSSVVRDYGHKVDWYCGVFVRNERWVLDGPTPLVAAMRAYVFAKLGPEVVLPA